MYKLKSIKSETHDALYDLEDIFKLVAEAHDDGAKVTLISREKDRIIEAEIELEPFTHIFKFERIENNFREL